MPVDLLCTTVLVLDEDAGIRRLLKSAFGSTRYKVLEADQVAEGFDMILRKRPDLLLWDVDQNHGDGVAIIRNLREWSTIPIIVISSLCEDFHKVAALDAGADDYVSKPFSLVELIARIEVAIRHTSQRDWAGSKPIIEKDNLVIDLNDRAVYLGGGRVKLTPTEFRLLALLAKNSGKVVPQSKLLQEVWGTEFCGEAQYLRVYMSYLRKKLEVDPQNPRLLLTEARVGYRLAI